MENCFLYDNCNHIDCDGFCLKRYKLNYLYDEATISEKQRKYTALYLDNNKVDLEAFKTLSNFQANIVDTVNNGTNIYIHSTICGNGKTSWALRLAQAYLDKIWYRAKLECKVLFINVPRFLLALKDNISEKSDYIQHIKENVLTADLVIWDEIGSKGLTQFEHENILSYINARLDNNKSNIYTSNLSDQELHSAVGDRLASRICNQSVNIELFGADKRKLSV